MQEKHHHLPVARPQQLQQERQPLLLVPAQQEYGGELEMAQSSG
jgi:hypothetical protein